MFQGVAQRVASADKQSEVSSWLGCRGLTDNREMWPGLDTVGKRVAAISRTSGRCADDAGDGDDANEPAGRKTTRRERRGGRENRGQQRAKTRRRVD